MPYTDVIARRLNQNRWKKEDRAKKKAALSGIANGNGNGDTAEVDAFGFPVGTHDAQGRKYGQLDDLYDELDRLRVELIALNGRRVQLVEQWQAIPILGEPDTLEQEIEHKARLIVVKELLADNNERIKAVEAAIESTNSSINRMLEAVEQVRADIAAYSEGGRIYINRVGYAEVLVQEAKHKKSAAEATLEGANIEHHYNAEVELKCAHDTIAKYSNVKEQLEKERLEKVDLLRVYTQR